MPMPGYKTITVPDKTYDYLMNDYKMQKDDLAIKQGIKSFGAYVNWQLEQLFPEDPKYKSLVTSLRGTVHELLQFKHPDWTEDSLLNEDARITGIILDVMKNEKKTMRALIRQLKPRLQAQVNIEKE